MSLHTSTGAPTKAQQRRFDAIKLDTGCVCCRKRGLGYVQPEIHHLLSGGKRRGHDDSIGLCQWHHRGVTPQGMARMDMHAHYGPSLYYGSKPFHAEFGSDDELLTYQNALLHQHGIRAAA